MKITAGRAFVALMSMVVGLSACGRESRNSEGGDPAVPVGEETSVPSLPEGAQAVSFLGEPLYPPVPTQEVQTRREEQLADALRDLEADPRGADATIWAGRRYAYMGKYLRAIELYSEGLVHHPEDARFLRHRGHRWISVREPDRAIEDFQEAVRLIQGTEDEVEPDGQPNAMGVPTSTLHFNIWYHYGLAHFIKGEFEEAAEIYRRCMEASVHADSKVATAHWWYMALRRAGREDEARELASSWNLAAWESEIIESGSYLHLLKLYAGAETAVEAYLEARDAESLEGATLGYGVGNFHLYNGRVEEARAIFERIVAATGQWAAFGYIAAEADLARMRRSQAS
jgi:tetratricopeptide (TPR) repeat protein